MPNHITSRDHTPNWMGLANTYGAFAAYRTMRDDVLSTVIYYENTLQGSYYHQVTNDTPLLYWMLKGLNTGTENDKSPNGISGTITQPSPPSSVTGPTLGVGEGINTSLNFAADQLGPGNKTRVETEYVYDPIDPAGNPLRMTFPFTIECWAKWDNFREAEVFKLTGDDEIRIGTSLDYEGKIHIHYSGSNVIQVPDDGDDRWFEGSRFFDDDSSDMFFNDDVWHHIVAVFTTNQVTLHVDGHLCCSETHNNYDPSHSTTAVNLVVGEQNDYDAAACHVALYDHALTRKQIRDHFTAAGRYLDLKFIPEGDNTPGTGEIDYERVGKRTLRFPTGIRILYGDKWADSLVITQTTTGNSALLRAIGNNWSRPARDAVEEAGGSFGILAGVISNDFAGETGDRCIFDNLFAGANQNGQVGDPVKLRNWSGGSLLLSNEGQPKFEWGAKEPGFDNAPGSHEELASGGKIAKITDGVFSIVAGFNTPTPVRDDANVGLLRDHHQVAYATGEMDCNMADRAEIPQVGLTNYAAGSADNDFEGKIGPIILFASKDMRPGNMVQVLRAIKGSNWPMRGRHSTRRPRRWYHILGPSRP